MNMLGTVRYLDLIIKVIPIEMRFSDRIDIDLELGFQYNKGSNVASLTTGYNFYYRNPKTAFVLTALITSPTREMKMNYSKNRTLIFHTIIS